ncbi:DNA polymerase III PolC [Campylobacter geochelonis]|nr:DNA polymerase III PolC [Campylobacter geochelonis]
MLIDLHMHSIYSDGKPTPYEIIEKAKHLNIGVSITDHNHIKGSIVGYELSKKENVHFILGMELGTNEGKELLIYFNSPENAEAFYINEVEPFRTSRMTRIDRPITDFISEKGNDKKDKYRYKFTTLPHPFGPLYKNIYSNPKLTNEILEFVDCIEVINASQSKKANKKALELAKNLDKFAVASTDAHLLANIGKVTTNIIFDNKDNILSTDISYNKYLDDIFIISKTLIQITKCNIKHSIFKKGDSLV